MVVKTNYDKIDISFHVEKDMVSVLAEHLPAIPVAAWEMYRSIGIGYDFGKDYHDQRKTPVDDVACGM